MTTLLQSSAAMRNPDTRRALIVRAALDSSIYEGAKRLKVAPEDQKLLDELRRNEAAKKDSSKS